MGPKNFHLFSPCPASVSLHIFDTLAFCWFSTPQEFGVYEFLILFNFFLKVAPANNNETIIKSFNWFCVTGILSILCTN